ncbi:MAG: hypothetical protein H0T84_05805 [Tatlockia sp.]|nr:hypothetical protein [Tatlockia sp.]
MISVLSNKFRISNLKWLLISLLIVTTLVSVLAYFFEFRWETNDDVAMSMIAHGYGMSASSPNLLFSNILWGYLVRSIPEINGIVGYSLATISVLILVGTVIFYGLVQLGAGVVVSFLMLMVILVPSLLVAQFTINAGLLMLSAIICTHLYVQKNDWKVLVLGCLLAFLSYLIRSHEFWLVTIVALPLMPWRVLLCRPSAKIALCVLIAVTAISAVLDRQAYQSLEWQKYNRLNPVRAPFTDFGASELIKQREDILAEQGYSSNDIELIKSFFFVDSTISDPIKLSNLLDKLGPLPVQKSLLSNVWLGLQALWGPRLLFPVLMALFMAFLRPNWRIAASWSLFIVAILLMGLWGRPAILRVYVPVISLLLIAPFLRRGESGWRDYVSVIILFSGAFMTLGPIFNASKSEQLVSNQMRKDFKNFPHYPVVIWGGTFPFNSIYTLFAIPESAKLYHLYGLGVSTLAPYTYAYSEEKAGRGVKDLLTKKKGVPMMALPEYFELLKVYCKEHFQGELQDLFSKKFGEYSIKQVRCNLKA